MFWKYLPHTWVSSLHYRAQHKLWWLYSEPEHHRKQEWSLKRKKQLCGYETSTVPDSCSLLTLLSVLINSSKDDCSYGISWKRVPQRIGKEIGQVPTVWTHLCKRSGWCSATGVLPSGRWGPEWSPTRLRWSHPAPPRCPSAERCTPPET